MPQPRQQTRLFSFLLPLLLTVAVTPVEAQQGLEDRLAALERRVANIEQLLRQVSTSSKSPGIDDLAEVIAGQMMSVSLRSKRMVQDDYDDSDLRLEFEFTSNLEKPVRAFKGIVVFQDLFEREIMRLNVMVEDPVTRGRTVRWQERLHDQVYAPPDRSVRYGEYTGDYYRMVSIDKDDLVTTFVLEQVVYQDGTRQQFRRP